MLLGPSLIRSAVCNLAHVARFGVEDHDAAHHLVDSLALEGDLCPIGGPHRGVVAPALWGVGDLAYMASIGVHREDCALGLIRTEPAAKDDLTVPGRATARALVVFIIVSATGAYRKSH